MNFQGKFNFIWFKFGSNELSNLLPDYYSLDTSPLHEYHDGTLRTTHYNITSFVQFVICRLAANGTVQEFDFQLALNKIIYTPLSLRWDDTAAKRHLDLAIIPTERSHLGRDNTICGISHDCGQFGS